MRLIDYKHKPLVRLLKRRRNLYLVAGLLAASSLILFGCNAAKRVSTEDDAPVRSVSGARQAGKKVDPLADEKARAAKACGPSKLFEKMDATMYTGPPEKYGDIVFSERSVKNNMNPVVFSHRNHRTMYTCRVCHLEMDFSMKKGESGITREDYLDGRYCGACHDGKTAFSVRTEADCNRCHIPVDSKGGYTSQPLKVKGLVKQEYGDGINWVESMREKLISPQTSLHDENNPSTMPLPEHLQNERLRWTAQTPNYPVSVSVWFPHEAHVQWLDCANCHPDIFMVKQNGTVSFDKDKILEGKFCGVCHLTVAFPMDGCRRCHPKRMKKKL